jgi:uncharacterized protein YndB with AHSA1/START domain
MSIASNNHAHAAADLAGRSIFASVEIVASSERVFRALTSQEIINWWIRPGVCINMQLGKEAICVKCFRAATSF